MASSIGVRRGPPARAGSPPGVGAEGEAAEVVVVGVEFPCDGGALDFIAAGDGTVADGGAFFVGGEEGGFVDAGPAASRSVLRASTATRSGRSSSWGAMVSDPEGLWLCVRKLALSCRLGPHCAHRVSLRARCLSAISSTATTDIRAASVFQLPSVDRPLSKRSRDSGPS